MYHHFLLSAFIMETWLPSKMVFLTDKRVGFFLGHIVTHDKATKHVFLGHQFCDSILLEIPKLNLNYLLKPNEKIWSQKHAFVIYERFFVLKAQ